MRVVGYKPTSKKMSDRFGASAHIYGVLFFQSHGWAPWDALLRVPCSLFDEFMQMKKAMNFKRILVAINPSPQTSTVFSQALNLAQKEQASTGRRK